MRDLTFTEAIEKADALKTIGCREIYLNKGDLPWHIADSCEPGGTHRLDMDTSVWFSGRDAETGLRFRWSFDIEPHSANGKGSYEIDTESCLRVMRELNDGCRQEFRNYLLECSKKVKEKAEEWQKITDRQMRDAITLRGLAQGG